MLQKRFIRRFDFCPSSIENNGNESYIYYIYSKAEMTAEVIMQEDI